MFIKIVFSSVSINKTICSNSLPCLPIPHSSILQCLRHDFTAGNCNISSLSSNEFYRWNSFQQTSCTITFHSNYYYYITVIILIVIIIAIITIIKFSTLNTIIVIDIVKVLLPLSLLLLSLHYYYHNYNCYYYYC